MKRKRWGKGVDMIEIRLPFLDWLLFCALDFASGGRLRRMIGYAIREFRSNSRRQYGPNYAWTVRLRPSGWRVENNGGDRVK